MSSLEAVVSEHIQAHWKARRCLLCDANNWTLNGPFALVPVVVNPSGYVHGYRGQDTASPVVAMVCRDCGNTVLLDYNVIIGKEP